MDFFEDSEKQQLMEAHLEPLSWPHSPEENSPDSFSSEFSDDASSVDGLWRPELLCQEKISMSAAEGDSRRSAKRKLFAACVISLVFMTGEVIGGYAAHSLAIMTDAAHLLTDFGSIVISLFSLWISSRPQTHTMTFGWYRAEILGMLLSVLSIWVVTVLLVISAFQRITDGDYDIDSHIMIITSGCAVGVNVLMVLILHQSGTSHGHSHSFHTGWDKQSEGHGHRHHSHHHHSNGSVRAAFIHVVGDLVQSLGVLLAATIIHFWVSVGSDTWGSVSEQPPQFLASLLASMVGGTKMQGGDAEEPEYKVADPICTFLFSALVLGTTIPVIKDVFRILMDGAPQHVTFSAVRDQLLSVRGVVSVHSLHMWSLSVNQSLLSVHVTTEKDADAQLVLLKTTKLCSEFGFSSITIQVER